MVHPCGPRNASDAGDARPTTGSEHRRPTESLTDDDAQRARFPLQLLTPKHRGRFLDSGHAHLHPHLPKRGPAEGGPFVELCAAALTDWGGGVAYSDTPSRSNDGVELERSGPEGASDTRFEPQPRSRTR